MAKVPDLAELLARFDGRVIAFDPHGGLSVPLPAPYAGCAASPLDGDSPLDRVDVESQGNAVVAFEQARRQGYGAASVRIVGETAPSWLEIFDREAEHGCFIAVATPEHSQRQGRSAAADLAPRQSSYDLNVTGVIQAIGPDFTRMFGWNEADVVGRSSLDFIHPDDHENGIVSWIELLESPGGQVRLRQRLKTAAGAWVWCELTESNLLDGDEACVRSEIVDVSREMAAQAALQQREQLLDRLNQALPIGVLQLDSARRIAVENDRWSTLTGDGESAGLDGLLARVIDPAAVGAAVDRALEDGRDVDLAVTFDGDGVCRFGELHLRPLHDDDGITTGLLLTLDDVTKLHTFQLELAEQARRDPLTGAYNRLGIEDIMRDRLSQRRSDGSGRSELTVLFLDLDRFKVINDMHGHVVGDRVLRSVADEIRGLLRPGDRLGRLGGDEFLVILGPGTPPEQAEVLTARIGEALPRSAARFDHPIEIAASIGIAVAEQDDDFDSLIKRADTEMYLAKGRRPRLEQPTQG